MIWDYKLSFVWSDRFSEVFRSITAYNFQSEISKFYRKLTASKLPKGRNKIYNVWDEVHKLQKDEGEVIIEKYTDTLNRSYNYNPFCVQFESKVRLEDSEFGSRLGNFENLDTILKSLLERAKNANLSLDQTKLLSKIFNNHNCSRDKLCYLLWLLRSNYYRIKRMVFDKEYDSNSVLVQQIKITKILDYFEQIFCPPKPPMTLSMIKQSIDLEFRIDLSKQLLAKIMKSKLGY